MKHILPFLSLGLFMVTLSSCDTYVNAGARPGSYRGPAPRPHHYNPGYHNGSYYGHNQPRYYNSRPAPRRVGLGVNTRGLPLNVNSNTRLGLF